MNTMQKAALCAAASLLVVSLLTACGGSETPDAPADSEKPGSSTSQGGNDATEKPEKPGEEKPDGTQQPDNVQPPDYLKNEIEFKNSWAYQQLGGILRGEGYYLNYDYSSKILQDEKTIGTMGHGNVIATGADKVCYSYSTLSGGTKNETREELEKWVRVNDQQYNRESYWLDSKKKTVSCTVTSWPAEYAENEILAVTAVATQCPYEIYTSILPMENEGNFYRGTYTVNGVSYEAEMNFFESRIYCFEGGTLKYIVIRSPYDGQGCVVESIFQINKLTKTPQKNLLQIPSDYTVKK